MKKHAYLIQAYHKPQLLQVLLDAIDDERNDIYVHIDKKSLGHMSPGMFSVKKASLSFVPSIEVNWGGFSQVECALILLHAALRDGHHSYYHLITNLTYPLKSQNRIHEFFEKNEGKEFIDIDDKDFSDRAKYYLPFAEAGKVPPKSAKGRFQRFTLDLQKRMGIDLFRKYDMEFKKGLAYWSVTEGLAAYVSEREDLIRRMLRHSKIPDEMFMQIMAYNSPYRENITGRSSLLSTWEIEERARRDKHIFKLQDLKYIMESDFMFARKFDSEDGELLRSIIRKYKWDEPLR